MAVPVKNKPVYILLMTGRPSTQKACNMYYIASNTEHRLEKGSHMVSCPL